VRKGDWKLMEFFEDGRLELYNLKDDVGETVNLAQEMPEKTQELHADMRAWRKEINAPIPTAPNPAYDPNERWIADPKYRGRAPHILPQRLGDHFEKALRLGYH
jgi:arylsulfatase A-like enzyme